MTIYKHVVSGPGAAGDIWTSGLHSFGAVDNIAAAHVAWAACAALIFNAGGILPHWADNTSATELTTYRLDPTTGRATLVARSSVVHTGTGGAGQPAPRDCVVVGLRSVVPGASGRGRMYLPAIAVDQLDSVGLIPSAVRTAIATCVSTGIIAMTAAGFIPGVWRSPKPAGPGGVPPAVLSSGDAIIAFDAVTVGAVQGNQRRRSNKIPATYTVVGA
jgi:hypothetical protein